MRTQMYGLVVASLVLVAACGSGSQNTASRDRCEATAGVGHCLQRGGNWVAIGSIKGTLPTTTTTSTPRSTTTQVVRSTLTGEFTLNQDQIKDDMTYGKHLANCFGFDGYDDLHLGTEVVVENQNGVTI